MAIYKSDIVDINLETGSIHRSFIKHTIGTADENADRFGVRVFRNGEAVDLSGCSCYGYFQNSNGDNIALTSAGTVDGNVAYVTLPQACYNYEGNFCLAIKLLISGVTSTVRIVDGVVDNTNTGSAVAPTDAVPSYSEILDQYDAMVAATAVANGAIATTFNAATVYPAGSYVINSGALYRITADHAANVTWANTSKVATNFGAEVTGLKSAFEQECEIETAGINGENGYASHDRSLIINTGNIYSTTGNGTHVLIPVNPGDSIKIKANSGFKTYYAILTAIDIPVHLGIPSFSAYEGFTALFELAKSATVTLTAPSDARYLYVTKTTSGSSFLPVTIEVNGISMLTSIYAKTVENKNEIGRVYNELQKTKVSIVHGQNLYNPNSVDITEGKYIYTDGSLRSNASYSVSEYIEVEPNTVYYFDGCVPSGATVKSAFYTSEKALIAGSVGGMVSETSPSTAKYLRISVHKNNRYKTAQVTTVSGAEYNPYTNKEAPVFDIVATTYDPSSTYLKNSIVSKDGLFLIAKQDITTAEAYNASHWKVCRSLTEALQAVNGTSTGITFSENNIRAVGAYVSANTKVSLTGVANIAKNVIYQFCATFDSFSGLTIGQGDQSNSYASWIVIDGTKLTIHRSTTTKKEYTHGMTISDFINVQILTGDNYTCNVKIQTNGYEYETNEAFNFFGNSVGQYYFQSETALADYTYTVIFKDATKPIYLFGDSYMSFVPERWVYYLKDIGCFNSVLINAMSGENSAGAIQALATLDGHPQFALWGLGMNDSSDSNNTTPATNWKTGYDNFIQWCSQHNCTPILATIPTVPQTGTLKNNEGKNYFIRSSGHRYVDFAKAVCPNGDGVWYTGMLNEDGVHPTAKGAIALFNRALADFPEIAGQLT